MGSKPHLNQVFFIWGMTMEDEAVKVKGNQERSQNTEDGKKDEKTPEPVEGFFKAGENSVTRLSRKTQKLARILEKKAH